MTTIRSFALLSVTLGLLGSTNRSTLAQSSLAYKMTPGETLRYKLVAKVKGSLPILDNPVPVDLEGILNVVYQAKTKTLLANGQADVAMVAESADAEVAMIPFDLPEDQVAKALNTTVTFAKTGEVIKTQGGGDTGFSISIPGIDPKRFYAFVFPVVFPEKAVKTGEKWAYNGTLLGGDGTKTSFHATLLARDTKPGAKPLSENLVRVRIDLSMSIDQKLNMLKKPVKEAEEVHKTRKGSIEGSGIYQFDREKGRFVGGEIVLDANIKEVLLGKPVNPDDPKETLTKVKATVSVSQLSDTPAKGENSNQKEKP